jgi:hypothetical protein
MTLIDEYIGLISDVAKLIPDKRKGKNIRYSMVDIALAAFSVFYFQCSSWLSFQKNLEAKKRISNVQTLFHCHNIPTDNHIRSILDEANPELFSPIFYKIIDDFMSSKAAKHYKVLDKYHLIAIDGTEYHTSKKIHCENCYTRHHKKDNTIDYVHIAVGSAFCTPNITEVIPFPPAFVRPQEYGNGKQDTECKATTRMLPELREKTKNLNVVLLLDAIYGNQPMIKNINNNNFNFIITAKEGSQKNVFDYVNGATLDTIIRIEKVDGKKVKCIYRFMRDIPLVNQKNSITVNYIELTEKTLLSNEQITKLKGDDSTQSNDNISKFAYITDLIPNKKNIAELIKCGRARWRIENGFNSLKNRGYNFEHNFGHGKKYLSSVLATLMILAFLINSVSELNDNLYKEVRKKFSSSELLFNEMFVLTKYNLFTSFYHILCVIYEASYDMEYNNTS